MSETYNLTVSLQVDRDIWEQRDGTAHALADLIRWEVTSCLEHSEYLNIGAIIDISVANE